MTESDLKSKSEHEDLDDVEEDDDNEVPTDRGYAWVILAASWCITLLVTGIYKSFGVLFIEIQRKYESNSSATSLIVSCQNGTYSVTSLFVQTVALRHFSSRQCIVTGGLLIALSFIFSSFAPNVETVIILLGCTNGIGTGLVFLPTTTNLSRYFKKYRSVANCISVMGGSAGGLLFSFLIPYLMETYAFFGTMLILGGIELHMVAFGLLMRPTSFYSRSKKGSDEINDNIPETKDKKSSDNSKFIFKSDSRWNKKVPTSESARSSTVANLPLLREKHDLKVAQPSDMKLVKRNRTVSENSNTNFSSAIERSLTALNRVGLYSGTELSVSSIPELFKKPQNKGASDERMAMRKHSVRMCSKMCSCIDCSALRRIPFILYIPCACCLTTLSALQLFLPPYAKDHGLSVKSSSFLITIICITDACSSVLWGLFADKHYIRIHKIVSIASFIISAITFFTPMLESNAALIAYSVAYGIFGRVFFNLYAPVMVNFLGLDCLRSALGIVSLAQTGCLALLIPFIGLIRDSYSSYSPGMIIMASIILAGSLGILSLPLGEKCEKKKRNVMERSTELHIVK